MKKITYLFTLVLLVLSFNTKAQCTGTPLDALLYTGDYYIYDITPDVLGNSTFNFGGEPTLVTLYSEITDASQSIPGVFLPVNFRSFDALYLPDAGVGQPIDTFAMQFITSSCEVTFNATTDISNFTSLTCGLGLGFGSATGGAYNDADDSEFTLIFTTNILNDCGDEAKPVELFFSRELLNAEEFTSEGFTHYLSSDNVLHVKSDTDAIQAMTVFNLSGQQLMIAEFDASNVNLDVSSLSTGIYLVQAKTLKSVGSFKFIVR